LVDPARFAARSAGHTGHGDRAANGIDVRHPLVWFP
jgi:hypothetical protein